jgi:hypothetical protein
MQATVITVLINLTAPTTIITNKNEWNTITPRLSSSAESYRLQTAGQINSHLRPQQASYHSVPVLCCSQGRQQEERVGNVTQLHWSLTIYFPEFLATLESQGWHQHMINIYRSRWYSLWVILIFDWVGLSRAEKCHDSAKSVPLTLSRPTQQPIG